MEVIENSVEQSGCNFFATKRTNKTAVATKFYTSNTVQVWCLAIIMCITMQSMQSSAMILHRHDKHTRSLEINNENIEWLNPCGGIYVPQSRTKIAVSQKILRRSAFVPLRKGIELEYNKLKNMKAIDIQDIKTWYNQYNKTYKFLPKLKLRSNISLTRWHRNVQIYVASFASLHRHAAVDSKYTVDSKVPNELQALLESAQTLLCEIETAINSTRRQHPFRLTTYTIQEMKQKLISLQTNETSGVNDIDLKFVKARYVQFVETTRKMITRWIEKQNCLASGERSANSGMNSSGGSSDSGSNESNNSSGRNPCNRRKRRREARRRSSSKF